MWHSPAVSGTLSGHRAVVGMMDTRTILLLVIGTGILLLLGFCASSLRVEAFTVSAPATVGY